MCRVPCLAPRRYRPPRGRRRSRAPVRSHARACSSLLGVFLFLLQLSRRLFLLRIFLLFLAALGLVGRRRRLGRRIGRIRTMPPRPWQLWLLLFLALLFLPGQPLSAAFSSRWQHRIALGAAGSHACHPLHVHASDSRQFSLPSFVAALN